MQTAKLNYTFKIEKRDCEMKCAGICTFEIVSVYFESLKNSLQYLKAQINAYGQYIAHISNLPTFQETQKHQG